MLAAIAALSLAIASPAQATPGFAKAWGFNSEGQLGNGTETGGLGVDHQLRDFFAVPVATSGVSTATALSGGSSHSLALLENGTVMAWGANGSGQLGDGNTTKSDLPVQVSGLTEVTAVSAGGNHSLALLKNGTVVAWGDNHAGQLGNGKTENSDVPVAVSGLTEVTAIAAGENHSLALLKNGTVKAWGENTTGQLGNGTELNSAVPLEVTPTNLKNEVTSIAAGQSHSVALLKNGTVFDWGAGSLGQLGTGVRQQEDLPIEVFQVREVTAISAGQNHTLALLKNGTVKAWGDNRAGQIGVERPKPPTPVSGVQGPEKCASGSSFEGCANVAFPVSGLSGVTAVAAGGNHSMALLANRTVQAWGEDSSGQVGNGTTGKDVCGGPEVPTTTCEMTPTAVCAEGLEKPCPAGTSLLSEVKGIAAGRAHSLAIVE
jgi:alpha-tubulin suppressor-like RCC1 family protein